MRYKGCWCKSEQEIISGEVSFLNTMLIIQDQSTWGGGANLPRIKLVRGKRTHEEASKRVTKKQTGAPGPTLSASMFYLAPICSLTTPIWFSFYCKKLGMGLGQEQIFIHFLPPKAAADAENLTTRNRDTKSKEVPARPWLTCSRLVVVWGVILPVFSASSGPLWGPITGTAMALWPSCRHMPEAWPLAKDPQSVFAEGLAYKRSPAPSTANDLTWPANWW